MPLDPVLATQLRTEATKAGEHTTARDRLILEAATAGASLREIAAEVGLHHTGVLKIIRRARE